MITILALSVITFQIGKTWMIGWIIHIAYIQFNSCTIGRAFFLSSHQQYCQSQSFGWPIQDDLVKEKKNSLNAPLSQHSNLDMLWMHLKILTLTSRLDLNGKAISLYFWRSLYSSPPIVILFKIIYNWYFFQGLSLVPWFIIDIFLIIFNQ